MTIAEIYGDKVQLIVADQGRWASAARETPSVSHAADICQPDDTGCEYMSNVLSTVRDCLIPTRSSPTSADTGPLGQVGSAVNGSVDAGESPARSVPG
jgi:hypothetical protein